jgi:hypothetical protein
MAQPNMVHLSLFCLSNRFDQLPFSAIRAIGVPLVLWTVPKKRSRPSPGGAEQAALRRVSWELWALEGWNNGCGVPNLVRPSNRRCRRAAQRWARLKRIDGPGSHLRIGRASRSFSRLSAKVSQDAWFLGLLQTELQRAVQQ